MKHFISLLISFVCTVNLFANDEEKIKQLVHTWNDAHNNRNWGEFVDIYAPQVLFYSKSYTHDDCYMAKLNLLKSDFSQQIISPVVITFYKSGTVKADFTKRTKAGKKVKEHFCYLLFKEYNGKFLITGESDNLTDEKRNVTLNLGELLTTTDKHDNDSSPGNILLVLLLITGVTAFSVYLYKKKKRSNLYDEEIVYEQNEEEPLPRNLKRPGNKYSSNKQSGTNTETITKQKGDDFEKYVVEKFNKPCFRLIEWRSDKMHNGVYAASSMLPDLEYHFKTNTFDCYFAVECKWRASFFEGMIEWAKEYQLENYRRFSQEKQMEVFVLIGIGGQPSEPSSVYIVPLRHISSVFLHQNELQPYYRFSKSPFYFDATTLKLS